MSSNGKLTITNVTLEDAGAYECQAVNSVGSAYINIILQIVGEFRHLLALPPNCHKVFDFSFPCKCHVT